MAAMLRRGAGAGALPTRTALRRMSQGDLTFLRPFSTFRTNVVFGWDGMRLKFKDLYEAKRVSPAINTLMREMPRAWLDDDDTPVINHATGAIKKGGRWR